MALFRRRKRDGEETVGRRVVVTDDLDIDESYNENEYYDDEAVAAQEYPEVDVTDPAPELPRSETGPFDRREVDGEIGDRIDLGSLWLSVVPRVELRIEIDPNTGEVQAVTTDYQGSSMQVQAFAAPRSSGIWRDIRSEIAESVTSRGGAADERLGPLGTELLTRLPTRSPDGRTVFQVMRFVGVDGPRWFLRAVVTGQAASDEEAAEVFYSMIRQSVIIRGDDARPPREMLPLRLPKELTDQAEAAEQTGDKDALKPFERGPEITEIR